MGPGGAPGAGANGPGGTSEHAPVERLTIPRVSPLRGSQQAGTITVTIGGPPVAAMRPPFDPSPVDAPPPEPPEPISGPSQPPAFEGLAPSADDEPPLPDEPRAAVATAATAPTTPTEAGPDQVLHVRFGSAPDDTIVAAFRDLKALIKSRPGDTTIVLHIPAGSGRAQEMRLGVGIAYDAELLAEVRRRFGGLLQLQLV
jgi:hypothetical protein